MLGERLQIAAQEGSTTAEPRGLPELRKQTWESKEAKVVEAPRVEGRVQEERAAQKEGIKV